MTSDISLPDIRTMNHLLRVCVWAWVRGRRFFHDSDVYSVEWSLGESPKVPLDGIERLRNRLGR